MTRQPVISPPETSNEDAGQGTRRRLFVFNGGFLKQKRVRRILSLAGYDIRVGLPKSAPPQPHASTQEFGDMIGVWGQSPTAPRGEKMAQLREVPVLRVEDALLRSVLPGRLGSAPIGLLADGRGVHFDATKPSDIEHLLQNHPLDDAALLQRARNASERLRRTHLSKYNNFDPMHLMPDPGYVLVVDQTRGDASLAGAGRADFLEMLVFAQEENPGANIIIKTHPETNAGTRPGHFGPQDENARIRLFDAPASPWALMENARAVYTWSSGMGFEAIYAGHKPRVFGQPFYAGWGLTRDENPVARRERNLTRAQLFAAAMLLYPLWYDPQRDRLATLEEAISALEAEVQQWRADQDGYVAMAMRLWKRRRLQQFFGSHKPLIFEDFPKRAITRARTGNRNLMIWAGHEDKAPGLGATEIPLLRVEDGFLRSRGLGAALVPPLSLVADDLGIYYDPTRESRLERMIAARRTLSEGEHLRVERLITQLVKARLSKYNLGGGAPGSDASLSRKHVILVPGQVENDASIRLGCDGISTNLGLLEATRATFPEAHIIYKPHPDCEAGLRPGAVSKDNAMTYADHIATSADPIELIEQCDEVATMTSLMGFEALLRGKPVTCFGAPFYAGWGLTRDRGPVPARRATPQGRVGVSLEGLVHATLIDYPRYFDPVSQTPCAVEVIVARLSDDSLPPAPRFYRMLSKLQGMFASQAWLWRGRG